MVESCVAGVLMPSMHQNMLGSSILAPCRRYFTPRRCRTSVNVLPRNREAEQPRVCGDWGDPRSETVSRRMRNSGHLIECAARFLAPQSSHAEIDEPHNLQSDFRTHDLLKQEIQDLRWATSLS